VIFLEPRGFSRAPWSFSNPVGFLEPSSPRTRGPATPPIHLQGFPRFFSNHTPTDRHGFVGSSLRSQKTPRPAVQPAQAHPREPPCRVAARRSAAPGRPPRSPGRLGSRFGGGRSLEASHQRAETFSCEPSISNRLFQISANVPTAAWSRLLTVPSGTPSISAICRYAN